ncbi:hypothetical protein QTO34_014217 [Cnephaeus nilssonii]|uniref:Uncharacterized protein n=1 Tax=Cnephaeus nilssonii TaxID=3371016 RepID=A0AA40LU27_CNENI|nr:hypothetical protein QTO34_014217 [Eptesicus nilssonii]
MGADPRPACPSLRFRLRPKDWLGLDLGIDVTEQDPLGHCHHMQIEVGYKAGMIKYSVHALKKATGRLEAQVVPFPFVWTSDSNGMECVLALYQEETTWGNTSCKTLSLLFPSNRGKEQGPPKTIQSPFSDINYTSCLSRGGNNFNVVPGRMPNELRARDQIAAGFESVLFWWSTVNENTGQQNNLLDIIPDLHLDEAMVAGAEAEAVRALDGGQMVVMQVRFPLVGSRPDPGAWIHPDPGAHGLTRTQGVRGLTWTQVRTASPDPGPSLTRIQGHMASPGPGIQLHPDPGAHGLTRTQGHVASPRSRGAWPLPGPGPSLTRIQGHMASPGPRGAQPHPDPGARGLSQTQRHVASPGSRGTWPYPDPGSSFTRTQGCVASPGPRGAWPLPDPGVRGLTRT